MTYTPMAQLLEYQRVALRAKNRASQARWRAAHPEQELAQQQLKRWKNRRRRAATRAEEKVA